MLHPPPSSPFSWGEGTSLQIKAASRPQQSKGSLVSHASGQELPKQSGLKAAAPLQTAQSHPDQVLLQHPQHHNGKMNREAFEVLPGSTVPSLLLAAWLCHALVAKGKKGGDCNRTTFKFLPKGKHSQ